MSDKKMTVKGFLTKTNSKAANSAVGFLAAYREYLTNSEVAYATAPIVKNVDDGNLMPTPALEEIKKAVFAHLMLVNAKKAEESINKAMARKEDKVKVEKVEKEKAPDKAFEATIIDAKTGDICSREKADGSIEYLVKRFDMPQDAERWADQRLFDGGPSWYGVVLHFGKEWDIIERDDSIARILKRGRTPLVRKGSHTTSRLSFGSKVKETTVRFSRG